MICYPCARVRKVVRSVIHPFLPFCMQPLLRYCVGLDVSKDTLQLCLSVIDQTGRVSVKATTKVDNKPTGFNQLVGWVGRQRKLDLPISYVMESTGVYQRPWLGSCINSMPR